MKCSITIRTAAVALAVGVAGMLGGCATSGNPKDPIEGFNRAVFAFNDTVDKAVVKPVAQGYEAVVPLPGRAGITNFFSNVGDVFIAVNNLLQGKAGEAVSDIGRVAVNSTVGILGLFDIASELGLEKHEEDFGQTLGRWGVGDGAYVVLPFLGPRTLRDTAGFVVDTYADPVYYVSDVPTRNILIGTRFVNNRAQLLPAEKVLDEAALDKYAYVRDAYLQRRRNLIYDGNPPKMDDRSAGLERSPDRTGLQLDPVLAATEMVFVSSDELLELKDVEVGLSSDSETDNEVPQETAPSMTLAEAVRPAPASSAKVE